MASHRQFQSTAKRRSVNGHHHRLAAVFDFQKQRKQAMAARFARSHFAEFFNVSSGDKGAASADHDRGLYGVVLCNLVQRF